MGRTTVDFLPPHLNNAAERYNMLTWTKAQYSTERYNLLGAKQKLLENRVEVLPLPKICC